MAYQEIWPGWETIRLIGSGGFGKVYEIRKVDQTGDYRSALKVISVPQTPDEYRSYLDEGYDDESIVRIFRDQIDQLVSEFQLMAEFKGTSNIVSYEDHMIIPHEDGHGWDVLIRMELLTSLPHIYQQKGMTEDEAIQVGMDICQALILCGKRNLIHRDIKPQNIFVNQFDNYKLGDFGISRTMDHVTMATKVGTYTYMAPEVYFNRPYGAAADQYSLGLVLYWLMNRRRPPFEPLPPDVPTSRQRSDALLARLDGKTLPQPADASDQFSKVILRACSPRPEDRYASPEAMFKALASLPDAPERTYSGQGADTASRQKSSEEQEITISGFSEKARPEPSPAEDSTTDEFTDKTIGIWGSYKPFDKPEPTKPEPPKSESSVKPQNGRGQVKPESGPSSGPAPSAGSFENTNSKKTGRTTPHPFQDIKLTQKDMDDLVNMIMKHGKPISVFDVYKNSIFRDPSGGTFAVGAEVTPALIRKASGHMDKNQKALAAIYVPATFLVRHFGAVFTPETMLIKGNSPVFAYSKGTAVNFRVSRIDYRWIQSVSVKSDAGTYSNIELRCSEQSPYTSVTIMLPRVIDPNTFARLLEGLSGTDKMNTTG
ncbi:MAG: serine/threonine protein kinase [Firmicutes bacterium]|nr:serine/threonine protein kinase [Bacillota bacterium]